jgi:hypothetical protein
VSESSQRRFDDLAKVPVTWLAIPKMRLKQVFLLHGISLADEAFPARNE